MKQNSLTQWTLRHVRLAARAHGLTPLEMPPYLVLHVSSSCNLQCEHCSEHAQLNQPDDLRRSELIKLSEELGKLESLHLTGGEPFLRDELPEVCAQFARHNSLAQLSISSSGFYVARTTRAVERILALSPTLEQCVVELSLDGTADFHNRFRGDPHSFDNAIQTYYGLAAIARKDPRLKMRVVSTATRDNLEEVERLSHYLYDRCPQLEQHKLQMLQGERRRAGLRGPDPARFFALERRIAQLWASRSGLSSQRLRNPLLTWAKARAFAAREQLVPCKAGVLSAVVYGNGDVAVCETDSAHPRLGNLREHSFRELWKSPQAERARGMIRARQCACANERCLSMSMLYQPAEVARAMLKDSMHQEPPRALPTESPLAYASTRPGPVVVEEEKPRRRLPTLAP
jgi:radical SAM protein with 4Fe4S-binding SPASM domain